MFSVSLFCGHYRLSEVAPPGTERLWMAIPTHSRCNLFTDADVLTFSSFFPSFWPPFLSRFVIIYATFSHTAPREFILYPKTTYIRPFCCLKRFAYIYGDVAGTLSMINSRIIITCVDPRPLCPVSFFYPYNERAGGPSYIRSVAPRHLTWQWWNSNEDRSKLVPE